MADQRCLSRTSSIDDRFSASDHNGQQDQDRHGHLAKIDNGVLDLGGDGNAFLFGRHRSHDLFPVDRWSRISRCGALLNNEDACGAIAWPSAVDLRQHMVREGRRTGRASQVAREQTLARDGFDGAHQFGGRLLFS